MIRLNYLIFLLAFSFAVMFTACKSRPRSITDIARKIRRFTPGSWNVVTSNNVIHIESGGEVWLLGMNLPGTSPEESEQEYARKNGFKTKYKITLTFVPRLSQSAYQRIKEQRRPAELRSEKGLHSK